MNVKQILADTICFGKFTLSSGQISNHYYDLRKLISSPEQLTLIVSHMNIPETDHVCGVPYGAIPLATVYSMHFGVSQIVLRKEPKEHGKKQLIEGIWKPGDKVVLIDDVWTTGKSILNAKRILEEQGLIVTKMIVVLYRGLEEERPDYLVDVDDLSGLSIIGFRKHISEKGKLCFSADLPSMVEITAQIERLHDKISVIKIHPELIKDLDTKALKEICQKYDLLLWADLKICDVPHIALKQLGQCQGIYDLVTVMSIVGQDTLEQLDDIAGKVGISLIIVPSLTSNGKLIWEDSDLESLLPTITNCGSIVGSVGVKIPGLTYIRAGISDETNLSDCDLVVRGRSLMK